MVLLIDENIPDSVATFLRERGHTVHLSRDVLASGAKDPVIAKVGDQMAAIVVTFDKDFKKLISKLAQGERQRFRHLGRISLSCPAPRALVRLTKFIDAIEFHYQLSLREPDKRLIVELGDSYFRVVG